jgi:ABC-type multidrug transport system fused ATPase/permease subunit
MDENIRLVVVDEPSAAMDPEGEFEIFKHLREAREGRTMIFITHRFGHLTKHADLILCVLSYHGVHGSVLKSLSRCMKEGELAESGTHEELIAKKGEYHNLYNIQAQAFAS